MKKNILIIFIFVVFSTKVLCQTSCGVRPNTSSTKSISYNSHKRIFKNADSYFCINIFFHIIRNSDGIKTFDSPDLDSIIFNLNKYFSPYRIIFKSIGYDFIDNSKYDFLSDGEDSELFRLKNKSNAINFYIVRQAWANGSAEILGKSLFVRSARIYSPTASHEVGHNLNLEHTFNNYNPSCSDCSRCGDFVCDTPPDDYNPDPLYSTCFTSLSPDRTNIMSYGHKCSIVRNHFTPGQAERMKDAIFNDSELSDIQASSCSIVNLSSLNPICDFSNRVIYTQNNLSGHDVVSWSSSSNVTIVSSTNTSVTIRRASYASSQGWVQATLSNGVVLREEFGIGASITGAYIQGGGTTHIYSHSSIHVVGLNPTLNHEWVAPFGIFVNNNTIFPTRTGNFTIRARVTNSCGDINYLSTNICVEGNGFSCGGSDPCDNSSGFPCQPNDPQPYSIYPNPASTVINIDWLFPQYLLINTIERS